MKHPNSPIWSSPSYLLENNVTFVLIHLKLESTVHALVIGIFPSPPLPLPPFLQNFSRKEIILFDPVSRR